jgi:hypothetical protein
MLAIALAASTLLAQEKSDVTKQVTAAKPLVVAGRVSNDGKMLLTDIDSEWMISNASALKGHEGHLVRVKCLVDSAKNKIEILSVTKDESNATAARSADSAFRR